MISRITESFPVPLPVPRPIACASVVCRTLEVVGVIAFVVSACAFASVILVSLVL